MPSEDGTVRRVILGFAVAIALLLVLLYVVGLDAVLAALARADPGVLVVIVLVVAGVLVAWSRTLALAFRAFGIRASAPLTVLLFATHQFVDNVTPMSAVVGSPFSALLLSRATASEYEAGLAAAVTAAFLNFAPAPLLGVAGLVYFAATVALGTAVRSLAASLAVVLVALATLGAVGWRYRRRLAAVAVRGVVALAGPFDRLVPGSNPPDGDEVADRIAGLVDDLEAFAADRRALALAFAAGTVGWLLLAAALWLSLYGLGHAVPVAVVVFAAPLTTVTELVPLPGGVGSAEAVLVLLLVPTTGVPAPTVTAAVLVYRGATYWLTLVSGGAATAVVARMG